MRRDLVTSAIAVVVFTLLLGLAYPLVVTGVSQVAFPNKADGSRIERDGKTVGSKLIGQDFTRPVLARNGQPKEDADGNPVTEPDPRYFQGRPSVSANNPAGTFFNNQGPNQQDLTDQVDGYVQTYLGLERPYTAGLTRRRIPIDAVTTSASSVDPHISKTNAEIQANRIAAVRRIPKPRLLELIDENTAGRALGFIGNPGVNVVELNLALDQETRSR